MSTVAAVRDLNQRLVYESSHHACVLAMKDGDISRLHRDLLTSRISTKSEPGSTADTVQALQREITLLQKNIEELKEGRADLTADRDSWRDKYWTTLESLDEAHRLISVNLHNAARFRDDCRLAEETRDATAVSLDKVRVELKGVKLALDDAVEAHALDLENWESLKSTLEASVGDTKLKLAQETQQKDELQERQITMEKDIDRLNGEIGVLQAELNKEKTDCPCQTDLSLLSMASSGVQATTDLTTQEAQTTPPELVLRAVQTINPATCSSPAQTDTPPRPDTTHSPTQTDSPPRPDTTDSHAQTCNTEMCSTATQTDTEWRTVEDKCHPSTVTEMSVTSPDAETVTRQTGHSDSDDDGIYTAVPLGPTDLHRHDRSYPDPGQVAPPRIYQSDDKSQYQVMEDVGDQDNTTATKLGKRKHFKFTAGEKSQSENQLNEKPRDLDTIPVDVINNHQTDTIKQSSVTRAGLYGLEEKAHVTDDTLNENKLPINSPVLAVRARSTMYRPSELQNSLDPSPGDTGVRNSVGISVRSLRLNRKANLARPLDIDPKEYSIRLSQAQTEPCSEVKHGDLQGNYCCSTTNTDNNHNDDEMDKTQVKSSDPTVIYKQIVKESNALQSEFHRKYNSSLTDVIGQDDLGNDLIGPSQPMQSNLSFSNSQSYLTTAGFKHKLSSDNAEKVSGLIGQAPPGTISDNLDICSRSKQPKLSTSEDHLRSSDSLMHIIRTPKRDKIEDKYTLESSPLVHVRTAVDADASTTVTGHGSSSSVACSKTVGHTNIPDLNMTASLPGLASMLAPISGNYTAASSPPCSTVVSNTLCVQSSNPLPEAASIPPWALSNKPVSAVSSPPCVSTSTATATSASNTHITTSHSANIDVSNPMCVSSSIATATTLLNTCATSNNPAATTVSSPPSVPSNKLTAVDKDADKPSFLQKYRDMVAKLKPAQTQFQTGSSVQQNVESVKVGSGMTSRRGKALSSNPATRFVQETVAPIISPRRSNPPGILKRQNDGDKKSKTVSWLGK